jgi:hypothetical protein
LPPCHAISIFDTPFHAAAGSALAPQAAMPIDFITPIFDTTFFAVDISFDY